MKLHSCLKASVLTAIASLVIFVPQTIGNAHPDSAGLQIDKPTVAETIVEPPQAPKILLAVKDTPKPVEPIRDMSTSVIQEPSPKQSGGCGAIRAKLANLGVPENQLDSAIKLAVRESTCNEYAVNQIGACGAFQSLPCGKWGQPGTEAYYRGAINYANSRYGGYNQALAHSLQFSWY